MSPDRPMLRVLGDPRVTVGEVGIVIPGATQRIILGGLVAAEGNWVAVPTIRRAIWPAGPPPSAASSLRNHIARLRAMLSDVPGARIESGRCGGLAAYRLVVDDVAVDALAFARHARAALSTPELDSSAEAHLEAALRLFTGSPYQGVATPLVAAHRQKLDELHSDLVELDVARLIDRGQPGEALRRHLETARTRPERERLCELMIRALDEAGRRPEALALFERSRRWLDDHLGLAPSASLSRVAADVTASARAPEGLETLRDDDALEPETRHQREQGP